ncbi:MAG: glycoside hydrolase family 28 protein [Bacteroidales bacterium]|nr:glycoside hydrolase family 28 protein [Bacteroidales bacterium]
MKKIFGIFTLALLLIGCTAIDSSASGKYAAYYRGLPGPGMREPMLPNIPDNSLSLTEFGAIGDGITDNTEAFEKAIAALVKRGGGHLVVPAGVWLTGPITLKNRIDLHLERNAMILLSPDKAAHLKDGKVVPGISASKRTDISISGEGIIDGNGEWWRGVKRSKVSDTEWNAFRRMGGTVTPKGDLWYPFDLKSFDNIADTYDAQEKLRTHLVRFTDCERVLVEGVALQNSPKFHLVPQRCKEVVIDGVTVRCPWNAQNGDGIDIGNCKNVLIVRNTVDVGDDGICMKGGAGAQGLSYGPCENILIEDNTVFHAHGGFVIGSEFSGGMRNIVVRHNTFSGTDTGLRFKSAPERGGKTENIWISDIYMSDIQGEAIVFETSYADRPVGRDDAVAAETEAFLPDFCDIHIDRVTCRDARVGVKASGTIRMIHDITLTDCVFFYTEEASRIDDPGMLRFDGVRFETYR